MSNEHEVFNPGFPIYLYAKDMELPQTGNYYVVAGNGSFVHKDTGLVSCFVPVDTIAVLPDLKTSPIVASGLPRIPAEAVFRTKQFFQEVVRRWKTEAIVLPYFNLETKEYWVEPPAQMLSPCSVRYHRPKFGYAGWLRVATIHSHNNFEAFHSGVDVHDEDDSDGVHITFGDNDKEVFTITASIVVNGYRLQIDPLQILDGIESDEDHIEVSSKYGPDRIVKHFRLVPVDSETENKWLACIPEWVDRVQYHTAELRLIRDPAIDLAFKPGSQVDWRGDMSQVSLKTLYGSGPFEVSHVSGDGSWVTVITEVGPTVFNAKLFKHACEENDEYSEN
jgi:hypothetical protein